jgi:hypothetical protein
MAEIGGTTWRTSSYSGANGGQCIEVAGNRIGKPVLVRDTKNRDGSCFGSPRRHGAGSSAG